MGRTKNRKVAFGGQISHVYQYGGLRCINICLENCCGSLSFSPPSLCAVISQCCFVVCSCRVKQCTEENIHLVKRIKALQTQNQTLVTQLKKLQSVLARGTTKTAQPATCLMVLLLSMALVMAPNLRLNQGSPASSDSQKDQDLSQSKNKVAPLAG